MSVPAIKAVALGDGFDIGGHPGSESHDEIASDLGRSSDRAGGTEGGITIGGTLRTRVVMKPLSTLKKRLRTVDMATGSPAEAFQERTDVCAVPAAGVVCEAMVALVLADAILEKFGGDTLGDVRVSLDTFLAKVRRRGEWSS
jgi:chorismate synthase